jgi:hypothetical protein
MGAIGDQFPGTGWQIESIEARLNHGAGVRVIGGGSVKNCSLHDNGEEGFNGSGVKLTITGNSVERNNFDGFIHDGEAGAGKFTATTDLVLSNNYVANNYGHGLWTDTDNKNALIEGNIVVGNAGDGIKHEISFSAMIRNNRLIGNGRSSPWLWGSQILIQNSQDVTVTGNYVVVAEGYGNGIGVINQSRGSGPLGPYVSKNNSIYANVITYHGGNGHSGLVDDVTPAAQIPAMNNHFDSNTYVVNDLASQHWSFNSFIGWDKFRSAGFEGKGDVQLASTSPE